MGLDQWIGLPKRQEKALKHKGQDEGEGQASHSSARKRQKIHGPEAKEVWVDLVLLCHQPL